MNKEVKAKWLKALKAKRNGKKVYRKAKGSLRHRGGYCCLGVLCNISKLGKWDEDNYYITEKDLDNTELPKDVSCWAKISPDEEIDLIRLNDDHDKGWKQVIAYIENNL